MALNIRGRTAYNVLKNYLDPNSIIGGGEQNSPYPLFPGEIYDPEIIFDTTEHEYPNWPSPPVFSYLMSPLSGVTKFGSISAGGKTTGYYYNGKSSYGTADSATMLLQLTKDTYSTETSDIAKVLRTILLATKATLNGGNDLPISIENGLENPRTSVGIAQFTMTDEIKTSGKPTQSFMNSFNMDIPVMDFANQAVQFIPELESFMFSKIVTKDGNPEEVGITVPRMWDISKLIRVSDVRSGLSDNLYGVNTAGCFHPTLYWSNRGRGGFIFFKHTAQRSGTTMPNITWKFGTMEDFGLLTEAQLKAYSVSSYQDTNTKTNTKTFAFSVSVYAPLAKTKEDLEEQTYQPRDIPEFANNNLYISGISSQNLTNPTLGNGWGVSRQICKDFPNLFTIGRPYSGTSSYTTPSGLTGNTDTTNFINSLKNAGAIFQSQYPLNFDFGDATKLEYSWNLNSSQFKDPMDIFPIENFEPKVSWDYLKDFEQAVEKAGIEIPEIMRNFNPLYFVNRPSIKMPYMADLFSQFCVFFYIGKNTTQTLTSGAQKNVLLPNFTPDGMPLFVYFTLASAHQLTMRIVKIINNNGLSATSWTCGMGNFENPKK